MGNYHITFLSRHPNDAHLCDDAARWWPKWYKYSLNDENIPIYGSRILFKQNRKSAQTKYMLWTDSVHLTDSSFPIMESLILTHGPTLLLLKQSLIYVIESTFSPPILH